MKKPTCRNVLIAEDNDDIRETIEEVLQNEGYEVYATKNGKDALAKLRSIPGPTLVLLDLMMPVMSGWEFLDAQKADAVLTAHQVVTISAVAATRSLEDPRPLRTAGSIQKPISLAPLLEKVQEFCGLPGAYDALAADKVVGLQISR
ncbi:MAG: response regulator [Methylotenera sp.]|nr:response regulator [Oligoflexia bacterium]